MNTNPFIEQIRTKALRKKEEVLYCISCNEVRIDDVTEDQLSDIYNLIGEFLEKGGEK